MQQATRSLTKRSRAPQACSLCRHSKSKCDGQRPTCARCARMRAECEYTETVRDKRMDRQEERRAHIALANKVRELESQLAAAQEAATTSPDSSAISPHDSVLDARSPQKAAKNRQSAVTPGTDAAQPAPDSTADAIATGLFDDQPRKSDIGYFGASSNHAFFWSVTASLDDLATHVSSRYKLHSDWAAKQDGPSRLPLPPLKAALARHHSTAPDDTFPGRGTALKWIDIFFNTVATASSYVTRGPLVRAVDMIDAQTGTWQSTSAATQGLLNIVFAHALSTSEDGAAEPYYRRALSSLDEKVLYLPSIESLQGLLLLATFQQNSQRAMESITTLFRAVQAAYQLGIHSPSSYERLRDADKELRSRLWFAVVNHDRMLGSGLGRPFLVPMQHVCTELIDYIDLTTRESGKVSRLLKQEALSFRHRVSIHETMGATVDALHTSNLCSNGSLQLPDLVSKVMDLLQQLEGKKAAANTFILPVTDADIMLSSFAESRKHDMVLTLYYYRALMLINSPLLLAVLRNVSNPQKAGDAKMHLEIAVSLLQNYLRAIVDFHKLVCGILNLQRAFLRCNAVWWLCNYMMVTSNLHIFAFWLIATNQQQSYSLGAATSEIEAIMRQTLDTLRIVGGSSIMSRKAHRSLQRYLETLTSSASDNAPISAAQGGLWPSGTPTIMPATEQLWDDGLDDIFAGMQPDDFLGADLFAMGYNISDFDATGFI